MAFGRGDPEQEAEMHPYRTHDCSELRPADVGQAPSPIRREALFASHATSATEYVFPQAA